ncbi:MAG: DUF3617 domain-containing protein [Ideonella sp.]|nr:DUF3617 domain-containing protein [Ideonella sp.]
MTPTHRGVLAAVLLSLPLAAWAQAQKLRPGLWEHGFSLKSQSGQMEAAMKQMQQSMASLPPDQRKMMEDMMARQGVGVGASGNTVRLCLTPEEAERDSPPPPQDGCTQTSKRSGNVWQVAFQCKGPPPSSGEGQVTLLGPTAYAGNFTMRTVQDGKPEQLQMTQTGKWLGADCGKVRPLAAPR